MPDKKKSKKKSPAKMIEAAKKQVEKDKAKAAAKTTAIVKASKAIVVKATPEEAKARTASIRETFQNMGKMWWELGVEVEKAMKDRVPEALGKSAHEWSQEIFGDSWLKVYRALRAVKALSGVDMDKLQKISEGNAYALARLPEKVRKSTEWIKKAQDLPNEKFKDATEKFIEKKTGIKDPMLKLPEVFGFSTLPKSLGQVITVSLKLAAKLNDYDWDQKEGRVSCLEAIMADYQLNNQDAQPKAAEAEIVGPAEGDVAEEDSPF